MKRNIIFAFSKKLRKLLFNRKLTLVAVIILSLTIVAGCSNSNKPSDNKNNDIQESGKASSTLNDQSETDDNTDKINSDAKKLEDNSEKVILNDIKTMAQEGKIINSNFQAKSTNLQEVEEKLGKADKSEWVADAKGNYSIYSKNKVVFGSNKGGRIFEIRSFDDRLNQVSLSMVEDFLGDPPHNVTSNGEKIIGYVSGEEFKILFVFKVPTDSNSDPKLDHYSVLYPKGTVNSMASDQGREW